MSGEGTWIERTRGALSYQEEALEFLARVRAQLPASSPLHAAAVAQLWRAAEELDPLVCSLLRDLDRELLGGKGELDTARGASLPAGQETVVGGAGPSGPVYECTWSLLWDNPQKGVTVVLATDPTAQTLALRVQARRSRWRRAAPYPVEQHLLEAALTEAYVQEATIERTMAELQAMEDALIEQEAALQRHAGVSPEPVRSPPPLRARSGRAPKGGRGRA